MKCPKWQDKVDVLQRFEEYIRSHASSFNGYQEAVVQYCMLFSKDFKVANINLLKAVYSVIKCIAEVCGMGPRTCRPVVESCVSKLHDKKLNAELCSLLALISEKVGPGTVLSIVCVL